MLLIDFRRSVTSVGAATQTRRKTTRDTARESATRLALVTLPFHAVSYCSFGSTRDVMAKFRNKYRVSFLPAPWEGAVRVISHIHLLSIIRVSVF